MAHALSSQSAEARTSSKIIYSLQHLRGIAASLVLLRHASVYAANAKGDPFGVGQVGVDLFFVISGIVIYITGRKLSWHVFIRRRIARIVPLYWLATAAAVSATVFSAHSSYWLSNMVLSFLFIPAHESATTIWPPVMAGWTLNFEMYFYVVCTLVLLLSPRRWFVYVVTAVILVGVVVGAPFVWNAGASVRPGALILLLPISIEFLFGLWIARLWIDGYRSPLWCNILLVAFSVLWLSQFPDSHPYQVMRPLRWGIPAAVVVWAMLASENKINFSKWRPGLLLGDSSYALYLVHPIVLSAEFALLRHIHVRLPALMEIALAYVSCVVVGIIVHKAIELRMVRFASELLGLSPKSTSIASLRSADSASIARHVGSAGI